MRHTAIVLVGSGLLLALLTGCPPTYPKCNNDEGCKEHSEFCVQGQCVECAKDANCKEGFTCQANKCVPRPPECQPRSTTCGQGKRCEAGKCVTAQCSNDAACGSGKRCDDGECVARAPGTCGTAADCKDGEDCKDGACVARVEAKCDWSAIHFEFNKSELGSEDRQRLDNLVDCIKKNNGTVTLAGYADERGTEEYNLLLSNKRAASTRKYLVDLGVPADKLEAKGFGENYPANPGHDEAAWAENRRVEFKH